MSSIVKGLTVRNFFEFFFLIFKFFKSQFFEVCALFFMETKVLEILMVRSLTNKIELLGLPWSDFEIVISLGVETTQLTRNNKEFEQKPTNRLILA